jgi:hypothetical protein
VKTGFAGSSNPTSSHPGRFQKKESRVAAGHTLTQTSTQASIMSVSRANSPTGSKFTVRGQVYVQTGAFFHTMSNDREIRILELETVCPDCGGPFQATASMRQIKTRQMVRRCPGCRKIHKGPVPAVATSTVRKSVKKKTSGRRARTKPRWRPAVVPERSPSRITLLEVRPVELQPGETSATALYRSVLGMLDDEPAGAASSPVDSYRDVMQMLD